MDGQQWGSIVVLHDAEDGAVMDEIEEMLAARGVTRYRRDWYARFGKPDILILSLPRGHEAEAAMLAMLPGCVAVRRLD